MSILSLVLVLPLFGVFTLLFIPHWKTQLIRNIALNASLVTFLISLLLWVEFDSSTSKFQFFENYSGIQNDISFSALNFVFGIDGISLFFIILTTFLIPVCILVSWTSITSLVKEYCIAFLVLESLMIAVFSVLDLLLFYVFFEVFFSFSRKIFFYKKSPLHPDQEHLHMIFFKFICKFNKNNKIKANYLTGLLINLIYLILIIPLLFFYINNYQTLCKIYFFILIILYLIFYLFLNKKLK